MKKKLCFVLLASSMMFGCSQSMWLHPLKGPLAAQTPPPVLTAKFTGNRSGSISITLSDGEVCKGRWARVPYLKTPRGAFKVHASTTDDMSSAWDAVNFPGFYKSNVLNANFYAQAVVSGNRGSVLHLEMYQESTTNVGFSPDSGVAKDDKGNIYKMNYDSL